MITDSKNGKINIYPHARVRYSECGTETKPLLATEYVTTELSKQAKEQKDEILIPNQVWDDDEVEAAGGTVEYPFYIVRVKDFDAKGIEKGYQEEQVHNVGMIIIKSRWLK